MEKKKILVTGGCGYIGGHTIVDLIENGFEVISVDDLSRGSLEMLEGIEKITGKKIKNYQVDLCDLATTKKIFAENPDIAGIIHFAAYKSVRESVALPLKYFKNNIGSLFSVVECAKEFSVPHFIFSSSCVVYGDAAELPVVESTPFGLPASPYARTKQMGEGICADFFRANAAEKMTMLRYFNPGGAHPSGHIGEIQKSPENLLPILMEVAAGTREALQIFGTDYPTQDGTCVRDYVHVMDIAHAHTMALMHSMASAGPYYEVFNLGTGSGVSVLELVKEFETVIGKKISVTLLPRRPGDVASVYADTKKAQAVLGWQPRYTLSDVLASAWRFAQSA